MTDRQTALDELIAGDADLYDVPVTPETMVDEWLAECTDGRVSSHTITMLRTFARWSAARYRLASTPVERSQAEQFAENAKSSPEVKALVGAATRFVVEARPGPGRTVTARNLRVNCPATVYYSVRSALAAFEGIE